MPHNKTIDNYPFAPYAIGTYGRHTNWGLTRGILAAWIITIPAAALVGGIAHFFFALI